MATFSTEVQANYVPQRETYVHRHPRYPQGLIQLPFPMEPQTNTVFHCLTRSMQKHQNRPCLGRRVQLADGKLGDYTWENYFSVYDDVISVGAAMKALFGLNSMMPGETQARIGIYGVNCPQWFKAAFGAFSQRIVAVPLYDTLGPDAAKYIINHAELTTVFCERKKLENVLKSNDQRRVRFVVTFEDVSPQDKQMAMQYGIQLFGFSELLAQGKQLRFQIQNTPPVPDDWAYIMYTSGTTGDPKGVIISHRATLASTAGVLCGADKTFLVNETDVYISYLPLAHIYECVMEMCLITVGASIGFYGGDVAKVVAEDIPMLKPTVMAGVPRIYARMYDKIMAGLAAKGAIASFLFKRARAAQEAALNAGRPRSGFWDKIMMKKLQALFGGRIRIMTSAAAPLSADLHQFLKVVFACPVYQAYGMTENAGAATAMAVGCNTIGTVGGPVPCMEIKLVDTDDYKCTDRYPSSAQEFEAQGNFKGVFNPRMAGQVVQRGEVWLRGPNVSPGYFKNPKETAEVFDREGWLHTGDVGQWEPDGTLKIIDRKKNIFKLAQGEYVSPEAVEAACAVSKWCGQCFVYGNSFNTHVVAIVVPDKDVLMGWAKSQHGGQSLEQICAKPEVKKMIYDDIVVNCRNSRLRGFEIPKDIIFETNVNALGQGFTVENDCLTPTLKMRRPQITKKYQKQLDALYAK